MRKEYNPLLVNQRYSHLNLKLQNTNPVYDPFMVILVPLFNPMAGAGTVLKVSKDLKRKCIVTDRDRACVEIMRGQFRNSKKTMLTNYNFIFRCSNSDLI